jgi:hypothetical protein
LKIFESYEVWKRTIDIMTALRGHPNIIPLLNYGTEPLLFIVTPIGGKDSWDIPLTLEEFPNYAKQLFKVNSNKFLQTLSHRSFIGP